MSAGRWPEPGCPDDEHDFGPEREMVAAHGPMEGRWVVEECRSCNMARLAPKDGGDALGPLLAKLRSLGLKVEPVYEGEAP